MLYLIEKKEIPRFLTSLTEKWDVYAPLVQSGGDVLFERIDGKDGLEFDAIDTVSRPIIPPKEVFFPQSEVMFEWKDDRIDVREEVLKPRLIFGVKPCDFHALKLAEEFFGSNIEDFYYVRKSKDALYIVTACLNPPEPNACFCSSTGTGPFLTKDSVEFDIQLVEREWDFIVEVGSERGEKFVAENSEFFRRDQSESLASELDELRASALNNLSLHVDFKGVLGIVREEVGKPESENRLIPIYKEIADRCIYCGACLYACPTCTCFNVYDTSNALIAGVSEDGSSSGERVRVWDGCVFSGYTGETNGHNPRDKAYVRTARRYEHKLVYDVDFHGRSGCVGCGRCISVCPVDIGMSSFIEKVMERVVPVEGVSK